MMRHVQCTQCFGTDHATGTCPTNKDDLSLIGPIAAFIGARLCYDLPRCNSNRCGGHPVSTIKVDQHKEKFYGVRVYCTLAHDELVSALWLATRQRERDGEEPPPKFRAHRLRMDAWHYRTCYLDMVRIVPRLAQRITACADYPELLYATAGDLNAALSGPEMSQFVQLLLERYGVDDEPALRALLGSFYERPSINDLF